MINRLTCERNGRALERWLVGACEWLDKVHLYLGVFPPILSQE